MGLHFSLVAYLIIDLANFFCLLLYYYGLFMIYLENDSLSYYIYLPYLKMMAWGVYYFCSGVLVVTNPLDFCYQFWVWFCNSNN
jgi:hypothetical protein